MNHMEMKKQSRLKIIGLIGIAALALASFRQMLQLSAIEKLQQEPLSIEVEAIRQSRPTSCGEAVIVMAYNHAYPGTPVSEQDVIEYAASQGYFTEEISPFTSLANMAKIARHYTAQISTGRVLSPNQGLYLLVQCLRAGEPVIIDVLSNFSDPGSDAHFIVVTGISTDPNRENALVIHYNDPLTGAKEMDDWSGDQGVWHAWHNNGDPGGPGWWMVISPSQT
jgi:hypothetical protein